MYSLCGIKMQWICSVGIVLFLLGSVLCEEHAHHGPRASHETANGAHNPAFDHEAVLGSEDLEEEFAGLSPEEAMKRLRILAEQHDIDKDGQISKHEMYTWITSSFLNLDREESNERFEEEDEDKDGRVDWKEYMKKSFGLSLKDIEEMRQVVQAGDTSDEGLEMEKTLKMVDEDHRFFQSSDQDKDGCLSSDEYVAFYFPQNYEHMHQLELDRYVDQRDVNGDKKLTLSEFTPGNANDEERISSKENFADLDKDKDGFLSPDELKEFVVPGTDELAEEEANHLVRMADTNGDGHLSMDEIVAKTDQFVGSSATDYGNFLHHEEL